MGATATCWSDSGHDGRRLAPLESTGDSASSIEHEHMHGASLLRVRRRFLSKSSDERYEVLISVARPVRRRELEWSLSFFNTVLLLLVYRSYIYSGYFCDYADRQAACCVRLRSWFHASLVGLALLALMPGVSMSSNLCSISTSWPPQEKLFISSLFLQYNKRLLRQKMGGACLYMPQDGPWLASFEVIPPPKKLVFPRPKNENSH